MKTVLNVKTDPSVKKAAQKLAKEMGLPLSIVVNAYLKDFIEKREFRIATPLKPNRKTQKALEQAEKDINTGRNISPAFNDVEEAISYLHKHAD